MSTGRQTVPNGILASQFQSLVLEDDSLGPADVNFLEHDFYYMSRMDECFGKIFLIILHLIAFHTLFI